jgi:hypothetical protein
MHGAGVYRFGGDATAAGGAAVGGCMVAVACGSACRAGKHGAYTTALSEVNLTLCSTEMEPFSGQ